MSPNLKILATAAALALLSATFPSTADAQVPLPYFEDFEAEPACGTGCGAACVLTGGFTNPLTDNLDWLSDVGGTSSGATGPSIDHTLGTNAGRYLYVETSCSGTGYPNRTADLLSPVLQATAGSPVDISFWIHRFGATQGTFSVDIIEDPLGTPVTITDVIPPVTGNAGDVWNEVAFRYTATSAEIQVQFRYISGTSFTGDIAIDDFSARVPPDNDVGLSAVQFEGGQCLGLKDVRIDVTNFGLLPQSNFFVFYSVNGGLPVVENFAGPINSGETISYTFATQVDATVAGTFAVDAGTILAGDQDASNDVLSTSNDVNLPIVSTFPYLQDFEGPNAATEWVTGGGASWELATPANTVINSAYSGSNAWVTNATGNYSSNEQGDVNGPCFDLTGMVNPRLEMRTWWESEFSWDGAQVQTSTDGGNNWFTLGTTGDPANWYTNNTINGLAPGDQNGWTGRNGTGANGGSNGWVLSGHDIPGAAGSSSVLMRVRFGSDGSVQDEGFAFDDVRIIDNPARLEVSAYDMPVWPAALVPSQTNALIQGIALEAFRFSQDVTSITVTKQGDLPDADITAVNLWVDNGDGVFDPITDTLTGGSPQLFSAGQATFDTSLDLVGIAPDAPAVVFVSYDLGAAPAGNSVVGSSVINTTDVLLAGADPVLLPNGPVISANLTVFFNIDILPYSDGFDDAVANRLVDLATGNTYPTATTAGTNLAVSAATANDAFVGLVRDVNVAGFGTVSASSAPYMAAIAFPNGPATGALDYYFDLTSYDANTDDVWLFFKWNNANQTDHDEDNVFLSLDGGATWAASIYNFDFTTPVAPAWNTQWINLGAWVQSLGVNFNNQVVIRFQAAGTGGLGQEGIMLDDAWAGHPMEYRIERVPGTPIPDLGLTDVGNVPATTLLTTTMTVTNDGDLPLTILGGAVQDANNFNLGFSNLIGPNPLPPGQTLTLLIEYTVPGAGAFNFDFSVVSDDPRLLGGEHRVSLVGVGLIEPDIAVAAADGTPIGSGGTDTMVTDLLVASTRTATYAVGNIGAAALNIASVQIENVSNATVTVSNPLPGSLAPFSVAQLDVDFTPAAAGAYSFDYVINTNDPDTSAYRVTVTGNAIDPEIELSRDGNILASGATDDQGNWDITAGTSSLAYTISNLGTADLILTATVGIVGATNVNASVTTQPTSPVTPGASSGFVVEYDVPADGAFSFDVVVSSSDLDEPTYTVTVSGTGFTPTPDLSVSRGGNPIAAGGTDAQGLVIPGLAQSLLYTMANGGTGPLSVASVAVSGETNVTASTTKSGTIAAGASDTFTLDYTVAADGAFSFDVTVNSDDPNNPAYAFTVSGTGESQVAEIDISYQGSSVASGGQVDIGSVDVGSLNDLTFTISNQGNIDLNLTGTPAVGLGAESNAAGTVEEQPGLTAIPAGQSTTFSVRVIPSGAGAFSVTASIDNNDGNESPYLIEVIGQAQMIDVPDAGVTPDTGVGTDGGIADVGTTPPDEGGCGCSTTEPEQRSTAWHLLWLVALPIAFRRRRR